MSYTPSKIANLIIKHLHHALSAEEQKILDKWLSESAKNRLFFEKVTTEGHLQKNLQKFARTSEDPLWGKISRDVYAKKVRLFSLHGRWRSIAAAAIILLLATTVFLLIPKIDNKQTISKYTNDIAPGGNKATLTLANGRTIILDSVQNGKFAQQGNTKIIKLDNGQLLYSDSPAQTEQPGHDSIILIPKFRDQINTLTTPRGGQHRLTLPDGTAVWLNAASSIIFPPAFTGKERRVEITGEVYFEIAKNTKMPFIVTIKDKAKIKVLGTHFNINAYNDEATIRTTLLEGSVQVSSSLSPSVSQSLSPGQQVSIDAQGKLSVEEVDTTTAMAWKNGKFIFEKADIKSVMRRIARWYDVEVEYEGTVNKHFGGSISRDVNASQVFEMLELTGGVKFRIEDLAGADGKVRKKVTVMP